MKKMIMILAAIMMVVSFSTITLAGDTNVGVGVIGTGDQAQGQGQNQTINNYGDAQKDLTTTNINAKGYRGFANPGEIPIPAQGPAYFGVATPGHQFQSMKTVIIYKNAFTTEELTLMAKGCDVDVMPSPLIPKPAKENLATDITVYLSKPANATLVGYVTVKTDGSDDVSVDALAKAALAAREMGGNAIHITAEGVKRQLESFGWGIGLSTSVATMSSNEQTGTISSGGFGVSGGHAGYVDYPWLQIFVLNVK